MVTVIFGINIETTSIGAEKYARCGNEARQRGGRDAERVKSFFLSFLLLHKSSASAEQERRVLRGRAID